MHGQLPARPAVLRYLDGLYQVVQPGEYVVCAVTGRQIPLDQLRYWCVIRQIPFVDAGAALRAFSQWPLDPAG